MRNVQLACFLFLISTLPFIILQAVAQVPGGSGGSGKRQLPTVINLSGTVMQEDGSSPPGMLRVELVCDGTVREQALLDASGNFNLQYGSGRRARWEDASAAAVLDPTYNEVINDEEADPGMAGMRNANLGHMNLSGCELRAQQLMGFRSDPIPLGPRSIFDDPDVGVIILQRTRRDPVSTASVVTLAAPPEAVRAYEKARKSMASARADLPKAREDLEKAVAIYPEFSHAWYLLGNASLRLGDQEAARESFEAAISVDESYVEPYVQLAHIEVGNENFLRAAELTAQAKQLGPRLPEIRYLDGLANYSLNRSDIARDSFSLLAERGHGENYPLALCYLGMIESRSGDLDAASGHVRECMELAPETLLPEQTRTELTRQLEIWEESRSEKTKKVKAVEAEPGVILVGERDLGIEYRGHPGGVLILDVKWSSAAWVAGLRPNDIVVTVNDQKADRDRFGDLFLELVRGNSEYGTFTVRRDGNDVVFQARRVASGP